MGHLDGFNLKNLMKDWKMWLYPFVSTVVLWMAFGQLNKLKDADDANGCCASKTCAKDTASGFIWTLVMVLSIVGTIWTLLQLTHGARADGVAGWGSAHELAARAHKGISGNDFGGRYY